MKNKIKLINIGYRILGILCIIDSVHIIWVQEYISPTRYGILGIMIGILALLIKYKGK